MLRVITDILDAILGIPLGIITVLGAIPETGWIAIGTALALGGIAGVIHLLRN